MDAEAKRRQFLDQLRKAFPAAAAVVEQQQTEVEQLKARCNAQAAEIARLREALTGIQDMAEYDLRNGATPVGISSMWQIEADARAALAPGKLT